MTTPRSLELAPTQSLALTAGRPVSPRLYQFASSRHQQLHPPRTLCETALLDPKYALPILALQPELYPFFARCDALGRHRSGKAPVPAAVPTPSTAPQTFQARQLATYRAFIGSSGATSAASAENAAAPGLPPEAQSGN